MSWKKELNKTFKKLKKSSNKNEDIEFILSSEEFLIEVVKPSFQRLEKELKKYNREIEITSDVSNEFVSITVLFESKKEFYYEVKVRSGETDNSVVYSVSTFNLSNSSKNKGDELTSYPHNDISSVSEEDILEHFVSSYSKHILKDV